MNSTASSPPSGCCSAQHIVLSVHGKQEACTEGNPLGANEALLSVMDSFADLLHSGREVRISTHLRVYHLHDMGSAQLSLPYASLAMLLA